MTSTVADCLFCAIVAGTVPATIVASSDEAVAFEDITPRAPVHVLVVPRTHLANASSIDSDSGELFGALIDLANSIARTRGIAESGYRLVMNVGHDGGQSVDHLHLHLLGGRLLEGPLG